MSSDLDIIFEDNHIIAVNKGNHDLVQGDKTGDASLDRRLKSYLKEKYNKPGEVFLGVTHRLDRPVSGVVLFARTSKALARLNKLFSEGGIKKTYWAITRNRPPAESDTLVCYMKKNEKQNKSYCYDEAVKDSKRAELHYSLIGHSDRYYLLEVNLKTGRHHQIRAQLARMGCPIKGDLKYGDDRSNEDGGISLHARRIEFIHPVKNEPVDLVASTPVTEKLWNLFK
ncbi:MAG: RNA pseudouridine synthase [Bacteroidota bacterium]|nr:MAG: RNA pseudouridine synthase [Bacteroidota bacterium]